jgi:hypothetical protein
VILGKGDVNINIDSVPVEKPPIVEVSNVRKSYLLGSLEVPVLSNINVHVHRPPAVTLNETPEEFHISSGLR